MREGNIAHAEVNAALLSYEKTVIFGQQNRLRNGILMPDEKLTRFHAGHELVRFFYQGMNKLPEYLLDALLAYNISVTLVGDKDLLVFKDVRNHQAMHIGFTRKTIYIPEGVIREAIYKGWDSWAISEAVIRESLPLMGYLLILEFIRRAQQRLRSHATLGSQTTITNALKKLNKHLQITGAEEDDFNWFFRYYCKKFYAMDRRIIREDLYELADRIFDEQQERFWARLKLYEITTDLNYPNFFDLDRDIIHPAAYRAADIQALPIDPKTIPDILHDINDAARFRILRQTKTLPLLDKLLEHGYHGVEEFAKFLAADRVSDQAFLTLDQHDNINVIDLFAGKLQEYSTSPIDSIAKDFHDLLRANMKHVLHAEFKRFTELPSKIQLKSKGYLKKFLVKTTSCLGILNVDLLTQIRESNRLPQLLQIGQFLVGEEPDPIDPQLIKNILKKLDRHPLYHYLLRDQMRELTGDQTLSFGQDIRGQIDVFCKSIPNQPYRLSSDPNHLRICLNKCELLRKNDPNNPLIFACLAGIFIRLDKASNYGEYVEILRVLGKEAKPELEDIVKNTNSNDPIRQTILQTARNLLKSLL